MFRKVLQSIPCLPLLSSENNGSKVGKSPLFLAFHTFCIVCFQEKNLHFAPFRLSILVASSYFFKPNDPLLDPKTPLFNGYFALSGHVFNVSQRFCLYHCSAFLFILPRFQRQIALHLAPFHLAFSTKTHCVQHQNARHLASKRIAFSGILHYILLKTARNLVQMAVALNKNSFCLHLHVPPFCIKTNLRENRFFAARQAIG